MLEENTTAVHATSISVLKNGLYTTAIAGRCVTGGVDIKLVESIPVL